MASAGKHQGQISRSSLQRRGRDPSGLHARLERVVMGGDCGADPDAQASSSNAIALHDTPPMQRPDVIALFGPTGIGKTAVAIALAGELRGLGENPVAVSDDV